MKMTLRKMVCAVAAFTVTPIGSASVLSDLTGINCDVAAGKCDAPGKPDLGGVIQRLPAILQHLPQDAANLANPAGAALAFAIRNAKQQASYSTRAIPDNIRQQLQGYIPVEILQSVRYTTFNNARITLESAVMLLNNDVAAITLEDIVVFRNEYEAQNVATWAHELTHVMQYRSRGVETFANTYTTNAWVLENEAKNNAAHIYASLQQPAPAATAQQSAYFNVTGQFLYGDAYGNLYPADPGTGRVLGPANGRVFVQNGSYVAVDSFGRTYPAIRVR